MARGQKYNDDLKERAFALLAANNSVAYASRELSLPYSTVKTWEKKFLARSEELARQEKEKGNGGSGNDEVANGSANKDAVGINSAEEKDLVKLRKKKKEEFVENAWTLIGQCETLIGRRIARALESENAIDELLNEILMLDRKDLTEPQRKSLYSKISAIKIENVKELAIVLGTLYDKQALANKEPTTIADNNITLKFEDL